VTERVGVIKRVRDLAVACARMYAEARRKLGYPLLPPDEREKVLAELQEK
jgi:glycyl-tRNA synthetase alpha chain